MSGPPLGLAILPWGLLLALLLVYAASVAALLLAGRRIEARALAGFIPDCVVLVKRLAADAQTSRAQRLVLLALALYLLSPLDLVPDFLPLAGYADDAVLLALALGWLLHTHGEEAIRRAWPGPDASLGVVLRLARARG